MSGVCSSPCLRLYLDYHSCQVFVRLHVFVFISATIHVRCLFVSMSSSLSRLCHSCQVFGRLHVSVFISTTIHVRCLLVSMSSSLSRLYHSCQVFVRLHVFVFISATIHVRCLFVSMSPSLSRLPFMSGVCSSPRLRLYLGYHSCQVFVRLHVFVFISTTSCCKYNTVIVI